MFGATKEDLQSPQYREMQGFSELYDDLPDRAFFALAEEIHGWTHEDWGWYSEVQEFDKSKRTSYAMNIE